MYKTIYEFNDNDIAIAIRGTDNNRINLWQNTFGTSILFENNTIKIDDDKDPTLLIAYFNLLERLTLKGIELNDYECERLCTLISTHTADEIMGLFSHKELIWTLAGTKKPIYPRTFNQKLYLNLLDNNDITFAVGPAGTGKTFLAVLYAVKLLKENAIRKIILVRPVVEAGENLGFLPGDLKDKVDPYLIPLYDSLNDALGKETVDKLMEKGIIEIAPLAYMRGRTLSKAAIILDEAQNTTPTQMKMFLTRLGFDSKMIITGDLTQIDLPSRQKSGLLEAKQMFSSIDGIGFVEFDAHDVMRHPLVTKILKAFEIKENKE